MIGGPSHPESANRTFTQQRDRGEESGVMDEDSFLVPDQGGGERFFCKFASVEYRGHLSKYAYAPHVLIT